MLAEEVFRARPRLYRRMSSIFGVVEEILGPTVLTAEGEAWRNQRKLWMAGLTVKHLRAFFPQLATIAERLRQRWLKLADSGEVLDVRAEMARFTFDVTTSLAFGSDIDTISGHDRELRAHVAALLPAITRRMVCPIPYWRALRLPADRALERSLRTLRGRLHGLVEQTRVRLRARPAEPERQNFLEALLLAEDTRGNPYSDEAIVANALLLLITADDTTASTLTWCVHECCDRPDVVERRRQEARAVSGRQPVVTSCADADRLVYADAVAAETLRLRPVAGFHSFEALADTTIGDVRIPRGTPVQVIARPAAARANECDEPQRFEPARWLPDAARAAPRLGQFAFGIGVRSCPGRLLGLLEIRVVLAMLAHNFLFERVGEAASVREVTNFTILPRGVRIRLRRRPPGAQRPPQAHPDMAQPLL
ncbi:MAG TPA: cytochrome P450 [Polyangiaceae bacterium]|nr:cytochrome P450 [Polyangiaceae bacterium]